MPTDLTALVARASQTPMNERQVREQRQSFVYGNTHIENSTITREMVIQADRQAEKAKAEPAPKL